jgi:hypothetical protein
MKHELVQLAGKIDWEFIDREIAPLYSDKGRPGIETRFAIGLLLLKHIYGMSDEGVCERWVYDPYFQHFTGEEFFQHEFPHQRSNLSHWRKRLGDQLELLLAESLRVTHESGPLFLPCLMVRVLRSNASFTKRSVSSRIACFDITPFLAFSGALSRVVMPCVLSSLAFVATNPLPRSPASPSNLPKSDQSVRRPVESQLP